MTREYLIIDAKELYIMLYKQEVNTCELFNIQNIPTNYQKIVLKLYTNTILKINYVEELITGTKFDIIPEDNKSMIKAKDKEGLSLYIKSIIKKNNINEVINLYKQLKVDNCLEDYTKTIGIIFKKNLNYKKTENKILKLKK